MKTKTFIALIFFICVGTGYTAIIHVPADHSTIQAGIDAAVDGDTVLVANGTYTGSGNRQIDFMGKQITVQSEFGSDSCIIDCEGISRAFNFTSGETERSILNGFTIQNGMTDESGGAIYIRSSPRITQCVLKNNQAESGGALCLEWESDSIIEQCLIIQNSASYSGGGIYCSGSVSLTDCVIEDNTAGELGGGIHYNRADNARIVDTYLKGNTAGVDGGAAYFYSSSGHLNNCSIENNSATHNGGAIFSIFESLEIISSTITSNAATLSGGAVFGYDCQIVMDASMLADNTAEHGGMAYVDQGTFNMMDCVIVRNHARDSGGACLAYSNSLRFANCLFVQNTARYLGGAIILHNNANITLHNSTLSENQAGLGGGLFIANGGGSIKNCILWNDQPEEIAGNLSPYIYYSNIQGGYSGVSIHNIDTNPVFVTGPYGGYYLSQMASGDDMDSPCLDAGSDPADEICYGNTSTNVCMNERTTRSDHEGDIGLVDMGFHYFDATIPTPTPTPSVSGTPTPTGCETTGVSIWMPSDHFTPGDTFSCYATVCNAEDQALLGYPLFVILKLFDSFFFAPSFTAFDHYDSGFGYPIGLTSIVIIPEFVWPEDQGTVEDAVFYGALTDPDMTRIVGDLDSIAFGWSE